MAVRNTMISKLFSLLLHTFMYCLPRVGVLFLPCPKDCRDESLWMAALFWVEWKDV